MEVLQRRQKGGDPALTESDILDLAFLALISSHMPARKVWIAGCRGSPVRVYSDASFEPGDKLLGVSGVFFKCGLVPRGRAAHMPKDVLEALLSRKTQIFAAEAFAVLGAVYEHLEEFAGTDATFFVDNEAACASLIRGSSSAPDVSAIVDAVQWLLSPI